MNLSRQTYNRPTADGPNRNAAADVNWLKRTVLYREVTAEREEILRLKWLESEKAGHDIGFEQALAEWVVKHCAAWRKARRTRLANGGILYCGLPAKLGGDVSC